MVFVSVGEITGKREFWITVQVVPNIIACGCWQDLVLFEPIGEMVTNDEELTRCVAPFLSAPREP
jgi:hypothetical protein